MINHDWSWQITTMACVCIGPDPLFQAQVDQTWVHHMLYPLNPLHINTQITIAPSVDKGWIVIWIYIGNMVDPCQC